MRPDDGIAAATAAHGCGLGRGGIGEPRSVRNFADAGLSLEDMAQLLWAAQGITHSEGLRTAPSAGALYPAEVYLVAGRVATLPAGIYRYDPRRHQLARTALGDRRRELALAALHQTWIAD